ncbi:phosphoesterase, PA-phosphatase related [Beutenbergia cavernae DSM 12333]|uniref:Phosphoesterase, PA-phosphatase related n=1 Tax=Beutenbergia cavernae (strain ATCC BAA-8 / DSM 12333 / CCUG 43141 / JCM 11478 / NBRC 16432 / NCIMB 13614 / HKI 0122) TaxID=471853 RepID=C5C086_BEUC1|nr:hypothetical protein [Beutenbergia cavernae]ACQ79272.1 phosphoesterase, PA-phosphatase related [Beutenbergia cavernae DSM 12333]
MRESWWWRAGGLVTIAVLALAVLGLVVGIFVMTALGQRLDATAQEWTDGAGWTDNAALELWRSYLAVPIGGFAALAALTLFVRARRWWQLVAMALVVGTVMLAATLLRDRLDRPWHGHPPLEQTLPGAAIAFVAAAAFALVVAVPPAWRSVAAVSSTGVVALTGLAITAGGERVSDGVAALLVVAVPGTIALAVLRALPPETSRRRTRFADGPWLLAWLAATFAGLALIGTGLVGTGMTDIAEGMAPPVAAGAGFSAFLSIACLLFTTADLGSRALPPREGGHDRAR